MLLGFLYSVLSRRLLIENYENMDLNVHNDRDIRHILHSYMYSLLDFNRHLTARSPPMINNATRDTWSYYLLRSNIGVGKTCLMLRYAQDMFSPTFITTVV